MLKYFRICHNTDNLIKFKIEGEGTIAIVGNSNPVSNEKFKANKEKAFHGLALVIIKSTDKNGEINITTSSNGLEESVVAIK